MGFGPFAAKNILEHAHGLFLAGNLHGFGRKAFEAQPVRIHHGLVHAALLNEVAARRAKRGQFVEPARSMNEQGPFHAREQQGLAHEIEHVRIAHAQKLMRGPGRIEQRAHEVEQGPDAHVTAHRRHMLEGRMVGRGEKEHEVFRGQFGGHVLRLGGQVHAQGFQGVGAAAAGGYGPVAVFDHLVAHVRQKQRHGSGSS